MRVVHPVVLPPLPGPQFLGRAQLESRRGGQGFEPQPSMQRCVDEAVADVATSALGDRFPVRAVLRATIGPMPHHLELRLGHHLVVVHAVLIDDVARERLVVAEPSREVGERLLRGTQRQPGDVVHRVAEMGQLPVHDRDDRDRPRT